MFDDDDNQKILREQWMAFCSFHLGDYQKALDQYQAIKKEDPTISDITLNVAICMFYLGKLGSISKGVN